MSFKPMKTSSKTSSETTMRVNTSSALVKKDPPAEDISSSIQHLLAKCAQESTSDAHSKVQQLELQFKLFKAIMISKAGHDDGKALVHTAARMAIQAVQERFGAGSSYASEEMMAPNFNSGNVSSDEVVEKPMPAPEEKKEELKAKRITGSNFHQTYWSKSIAGDGYKGQAVMGECTARWLQCNLEEQVQYKLFTEVLNLYASDVFRTVVEDGHVGDNVQKETVQRFLKLPQEAYDGLIKRVEEELALHPRNDLKGTIPKNPSELPKLKPALPYPCPELFEHEDGKFTRRLDVCNQSKCKDKKTGEMNIKVMASQQELANARYIELQASKKKAEEIANNKRAREEAEVEGDADKRQKDAESLDAQ